MDLEFRHYLKKYPYRKHWSAFNERRHWQLEEKYNIFSFPATKRQLDAWHRFEPENI